MKKKSALIVSVAMVLVAMLALTTASFAWFTASMNPKVDQMNIQVTTSNALLIGTKTTGVATKNIPFKTTSVTTTELAGAEGSAVNAFVSSTDGTSGKVLSNITPTTLTGTAPNKKVTVKNDGTIDFSKLKDETTVPATPDEWTNAYETADNTDAKRQDFLKFDLYFKANFAKADSTIDVALTLDGTTAGAIAANAESSVFKGIKYESTDTFTDLADTVAPYYIVNALRVGFVATEVVDKAGVDQTPATADDYTSTVYEPNKGVTIPTDKVPNMPTAIIDDAKKDYTTNDAVLTTGTLDKQLKLFTMDNNSIWKMSVYIWIEGNDTEAINQVTGGMFAALLNFIGAENA